MAPELEGIEGKKDSELQLEYSGRAGRRAVTPVCTSSGEDASADMLYGDINLANHLASGESS